MEFSPIYPLTILCDRYGGAYSGGAYTAAWNCYYDEIPSGPDSDDVNCANFWETNAIPVGFGDTPNDAVIDLERRLANEERG